MGLVWIWNLTFDRERNTWLKLAIAAWDFCLHFGWGKIPQPLLQLHHFSPAGRKLVTEQITLRSLLSIPFQTTRTSVIQQNQIFVASGLTNGPVSKFPFLAN